MVNIYPGQTTEHVLQTVLDSPLYGVGNGLDYNDVPKILSFYRSALLDVIARINTLQQEVAHHRDQRIQLEVKVEALENELADVRGLTDD